MDGEMTPVANSVANTILASIGAVLLIGCVLSVIFGFSRLRAYWPAFKQYRHLLLTMVTRDITVKYRRSVLGIVWSILQPLFFMIIITLVFSNIFKFDIREYPVFYLTGYVVFNFVSEATMLSMGSVLGSAQLIKKVYIPKYIFPLQKCLFAFVNMLFSLVAVALVFAALQTQLHVTILLFTVPILYAGIFSFGLGLILSAAAVFFRDVVHLYGIWVTAWMYLTPILYPMDVLPEWVQQILNFNPLVHYVEYARDVMINGVVPDLQANLICIGFALSTLLVGIVFFKKTQDKFILHM
jgi:ABC-type polysaccharide/polyol phosphate export permease